VALVRGEATGSGTWFGTRTRQVRPLSPRLTGL